MGLCLPRTPPRFETKTKHSRLRKTPLKVKTASRESPACHPNERIMACSVERQPHLLLPGNHDGQALCHTAAFLAYTGPIGIPTRCIFPQNCLSNSGKHLPPNLPVTPQKKNLFPRKGVPAEMLCCSETMPNFSRQFPVQQGASRLVPPPPVAWRPVTKIHGQTRSTSSSP